MSNEKELEAKIKLQEDKFWKAREDYKQFLANLGYVENWVNEYDINNVVYMVHPDYIDRWKDSWAKNVDNFPSWAIKEIGFFGSEDK